MKISKHIHSCLLVENEGKTVLIDPGNYTFEEEGLDLKKLERLDAILITHEHPDHFYPPFLKRILTKFPKAEIFGSAHIQSLLMKESVVSGGQNNNIFESSNAPHAALLGGEKVENTLFDIFGRLTHPGDSLAFDRTCGILAMPIQAPWGSFVASVEKAAELKPKIVIPIHDWHWKDAARRKLYSAAKEYLSAQGIDFKGLETGEALML